MNDECNDKNCPAHSSLSLRGRVFKGVVIADKMQNTVTIEWGRRENVKKFERYEKKRTRIKAHNPSCINAQKGDIVEIIECRPLSKTKNFVVIKKIGKERLFMEREKMLEESKVKKKEEKDAEEKKDYEKEPEEYNDETEEIEEEDESN